MKDRRQFFKVMVRGGILASLTLLGGVLVRRWSEAEDCQQRFACGSCNLSARCRLPEADHYRLNKSRSLKTNNENGVAGRIQ